MIKKLISLKGCRITVVIDTKCGNKIQTLDNYFLEEAWDDSIVLKDRVKCLVPLDKILFIWI